MSLTLASLWSPRVVVTSYHTSVSAATLGSMCVSLTATTMVSWTPRTTECTAFWSFCMSMTLIPSPEVLAIFSSRLKPIPALVMTLSSTVSSSLVVDTYGSSIPTESSTETFSSLCALVSSWSSTSLESTLISSSQFG